MRELEALEKEAEERGIRLEKVAGDWIVYRWSLEQKIWIGNILSFSTRNHSRRRVLDTIL
jgi:chromosome segregation and condensation protein ScpB